MLDRLDGEVLIEIQSWLVLDENVNPALGDEPTSVLGTPSLFLDGLKVN
jgi:hypothetical protein